MSPLSWPDGPPTLTDGSVSLRALRTADARTDRLLGACSLKSVDWARGVAEGGYWVVPWARGRKVAQRAVRLMCDWALAEVGLRQLEFFVEPANAASCAVVENLGCAREELVRDKEVIRGTRRDIARYALQK